MRLFLIQLCLSSLERACFYQRGAMRNDFQNRKRQLPSMENGMLAELRGRSVRAIAYSSYFKPAVLTLFILMTTVSCTTLDECLCLPSFSLPGVDPVNQQLAQRDEEQPKVRREQPKNSAPKVATVPTPKAKKTNTSTELDTQRERQLFQEFLQWRNRQKDL
jgi:hypothetical protein